MNPLFAAVLASIALGIAFYLLDHKRETTTPEPDPMELMFTDSELDAIEYKKGLTR